ncbi:MAG TPA: 50S ribosomal protein L9 [Bacteroidales bacterium]|nr:50S ribosomal protein L9 [Bacteroidales bacterium]
MEIILKQDIKGLGIKDDVVKVKDGYGRNYLIPSKMAILATESARKVLAENIKQAAHKQVKLKAAAEEIAAKMEGLELTLGAKTSSTGKIFGSVNTIQLAEALAQKGFEIDRKTITILDDSIKHVGTYKASVRLHREVKVEISFNVVSE